MSREYCDFVLDLLLPLGGVSARRMFGGFGLFKSGLMFGIIIDDVLYFKTGGSNRAAYEAAGTEPFRYAAKGKSVTLSYWSVPAEVLDDSDAALAWADKACRAARQAKDGMPKRKSACRKRQGRK